MRRILAGLQHIKTPVARFTNRRFMIGARRCDKFIDVLRFDVNVNKCDVHFSLLKFRLPAPNRRTLRGKDGTTRYYHIDNFARFYTLSPRPFIAPHVPGDG